MKDIVITDGSVVLPAMAKVNKSSKAVHLMLNWVDPPSWVDREVDGVLMTMPPKVARRLAAALTRCAGAVEAGS